MSHLSIGKHHKGDVVILDIHGRITLGEASSTFRDSVAAVIETGSKKILANMMGVGYIDSTGLGELVSAFELAEQHGAVLKLVNVTGRVQILLQMTKQISSDATFDRERDALRSFATVRVASTTA